MQNFRRYGIPKAQLIIADVPYNVGNNFYGSNPMWYVGICNGLAAEFEPDETLPDIIAQAELIRCTKDKGTGCVVLEIKSEEEEDE